MNALSFSARIKRGRNESDYFPFASFSKKEV